MRMNPLLLKKTVQNLKDSIYRNLTGELKLQRNEMSLTHIGRNEMKSLSSSELVNFETRGLYLRKAKSSSLKSVNSTYQNVSEGHDQLNQPILKRLTVWHDIKHVKSRAGTIHELWYDLEVLNWKHLLDPKYVLYQLCQSRRTLMCSKRGRSRSENQCMCSLQWRNQPSQ